MKTAIKLAIHLGATVLVTPVLITYWLGSLVLGKDRAIEGATQTLALLPGITGIYLRRAFLCLALEHCHRSAEVGFGTIFSQAGAILDENVYVGPNCHLGLVHLKPNVLVAAGVHIPSGPKTHYFDDPNIPIKDQGGERVRVTVGAGSWIGSAAVVMADIGEGSIVAAGSVVTKPVPEFVIAGGVPAKVLRGRFEKSS